MSTCYQECPREMLERVDGMKLKYSELMTADVTITCLFARNDDGPALVHHGWPARALIKINNLRDRVAGLRDLTLMIDEEGWQDIKEKQRTALIDHELFHIEVVKNKVGGIKYDDANRPKVRLKPHDFTIAGFHEMARRHGLSSFEVADLHAVAKSWKQREFSFMDEEALAVK